MDCEELNTTLTDPEIDRYAEMLKVLSSPARLRIVNVLNERELTVSDICDHTGLKQSLVSQQLKNLRLNGIVERRKEVPKVYYSLREKNVINVLKCLGRCASARGDRRK
ncbi:MAG TPA: metalloregulator ArsR/SmtB family transcription factor [Candidatus Krumholzibacterium sp.]|nr:metalloregulator ArsR/SmtB family transcription factor [Candidatus Krumholzibacterium sp.]